MDNSTSMDNSTLIHKVLSGNATEAEKVQLQTWISSDPDHAEEFEDIKYLYDNASDVDEGIMERDDRFYDGLRKLQARIAAIKRARKRARLFQTAGIAILISTIIMIASMYLFNLNERSGVTSEPSGKTDNAITSAIRLNGNLSFEDATLKSIFALLEGRYHLIFKVDSEAILSCRFTGTFYRQVTVDEMIRTLANSEDFTYTAVNARTYELQGKGCP